MFKRDVVFRGGVAKLDRPKGKRPSELYAELKSSVTVSTNPKSVIKVSLQDLQQMSEKGFKLPKEDIKKFE